MSDYNEKKSPAENQARALFEIAEQIGRVATELQWIGRGDAFVLRDPNDNRPPQRGCLESMSMALDVLNDEVASVKGALFDLTRHAESLDDSASDALDVFKSTP